MTYQTFLTKLQETPRGWWFVRDEDGSHCIRANTTNVGGSHQCCPITALEPELLSAGSFILASDRLGLDRDMMLSIIDAADDLASGDPNIRLDLLKATGLSDE